MTGDRVLRVAGVCLLLVFCLCGLLMEYGFFSYGRTAPADFSLVSPAASASAASPSAAGPAASAGSLAPAGSSAAAAAPRSFAASAAPASSHAAQAASQADPQPGEVNLNAAGEAELQTLPGIGPVLAERIVRYREENGPFATVDDLTGVKGIGEKKLEALRPYVTIN